MNVFLEILSISLTASPWLLIGLLGAGLIRAFLTNDMLRRFMGGRGFAVVARAAVIGAPFPLCSCGAIPTALSLYRGGAGRGPVTAFLIGAPGTGVDSLMLTYALMGPFMAVSRALAAVAAAISTGLAVASTGGGHPGSGLNHLQGNDSIEPGQCVNVPTESINSADNSLSARLRSGLRYAFHDILGDIIGWVALGLVLAGLLTALVPPSGLAQYGSGLLPMMFMAVVGIPLYVCASAITPVGAGMLAAGVSPGTVLVLLLAAPITSMATLGIMRREMGNKALFCYLAGIFVVSIASGIIIDKLVFLAAIDVAAQMGAASEILPGWAEIAALAVLLVLAVYRFRGRFIPVTRA